MATTPTQSRLLTVAKHHPDMKSRWPEQAHEMFHHAVTPARAVSLYALRPGHGYCGAWISVGQQGVNYYRDEASGRAWIRRAIADLEAQEFTP